jgi:hypothetical protein
MPVNPVDSRRGRNDGDPPRHCPWVGVLRRGSGGPIHCGLGALVPSVGGTLSSAIGVRYGETEVD